MNNRNNFKIKLAALVNLLCLCFVLVPVLVKAQTEGGTTKERLVALLRSKQYQAADIAEVIKRIGVNFQLTPEIEKELVAAGARPVVIEAVRKSYRQPVIDKKSGSGGNGKSAAQGGDNSLKTVNAPVKNEANYDALIDEAIALYDKAKKPFTAVETLQRAIKLAPTKPRAHQSLGFIQLYGFKNFKEAELSMRKAIESGGSAVFRVIHAHDRSFSYSCTGSLYISQGAVRFESDDNAHTFQTPDSDIVKIKEVSGLRRLFQRKSAAFKIVLRDRSEGDDKDTFNFSPLTGESEESEMIVRLVGKN